MKKLLSILTTSTLTVTSANILSENIVNKANIDPIFLSSQISNDELQDNNIYKTTYFLSRSSWTANPLINEKIRKTTLAIADNSNGGRCYATFDGVYYTSSGDGTANPVKIGGIDKPIAQITVAPSNDVYFITIDGNAYFLESHNSVAWEISKNYSQIRNVLTIATNSNSDAYFATANGLYYATYDDGLEIFNVTKIGGIDEPIAQITVAYSNSVYFIAVSGNAYYLSSGWWTAVKIDTYYNVPEIHNVLTIATTSGNAVYYSTDHGIYYMRNNGWTANKIAGIDEPIAQITVDASASVYFTAVSGNAYYLDAGWWTAVKIDTYYNVPEIHNVLTISVTSGNAVYYGTDHGVYYMRSNGWTAYKIGGINEPIVTITINSSADVCFESLFSFSNTNKDEQVIKTDNLQQDNPEIIIDPNDDTTIQGVELLHRLQRNGDYGLVPVNRINRGYLNFVNSFGNVMQYLINQRIVRDNTDPTDFRFQRGIPYRLNRQNTYFVINVNITTEANRRLQLVFETNHLYLQGFIVRNGNERTSPGTYYYFRGDDVIRNLGDPTITSQSLSINGHYSGTGSLLSRDRNPNINWNLIIQSFRELLNYSDRTRLDTIQDALTRVIFATSESWRFNHLYTAMAQVSTDTTRSFPWDNFDRDLTSWTTRGNFQGPLDIDTIFDRNGNLIDLRHFELSFFSSLRIANSRQGS